MSQADTDRRDAQLIQNGIDPRTGKKMAQSSSPQSLPPLPSTGRSVFSTPEVSQNNPGFMPTKPANNGTSNNPSLVGYSPKTDPNASGVARYRQWYGTDAQKAGYNDPYQKYSFWNNDQDRASQLAYDSARQILGRDISDQEFAQILPYFSNQGAAGKQNGQGYLANLAQQYKQNPSLDPTSAQNNRKPEDYSKSVTDTFQSTLGRAPTAEELQHFSQQIQSGATDAYGLSGFLKQQPEYTNPQDQKFRSGLNTELQNYDTQEFNREKGDVISAYGKNGMAPGTSPSLDYALTDLMGKIASNRSAYLANLSSSQYGGNKDLAVGNYKNTLDQMYSQNQQNRAVTMGQNQQFFDQGIQGANYGRQMGDYMNYMDSQQNRPLNSRDWTSIGANVGGNALFSYLSHK